MSNSHDDIKAETGITPDEGRTLVITFRCSAALSIIGSSLILWDICKSGKIKRQCRLRLLTGISAFDLLSSIAYFMGPLATPKSEKSEYFGLKAIGNHETCQAQGFFLSMYLVSISYNLCLAMVYVIIIKYSKSENWIKAKVEPWMHLYSLCYGVGVSLAMLPFGLNLYKEGLFACRVEIDKREVFVNAFYAAYTLIVMCLISILMVILYVTVKKQENSVKNYLSRNQLSGPSQSQKIARQCFAFSASFLVVYIPFIVGNWSDLTDPGSDHQFVFAIIIAILIPFQGFLNAFVYFRPRIVKNMGAAATKWSTYISTLRSDNGLSDSNQDNEDPDS